MANLDLRGAFLTLLAFTSVMGFARPSYAQWSTSEEKIAQSAREAGYRARGQGDYNEAIKQFEIGCNNRSADSCAQLGMIFSHSRVGAENGGIDLPKSITYFEQAIKITPNEQTATKYLPFTLGNMAWHRKELSKAAAYWRIACYWKVRDSCSWLGDMFREGNGVPKSDLQAIALYNRELILTPRHPSARPNADLLWAAFQQSPLGYNAYPEASARTKKLLREIVQYDSQFWSNGRLTPTALEKVKIISGVDGSSSYSVRADYFIVNPFGSETKNWIVAEMSGDKIFCLQYGGSNEGCRGMYTADKNRTSQVDVISFLFSSGVGSSEGGGCELRQSGVNAAGGAVFSLKC